MSPVPLTSALEGNKAMRDKYLLLLLQPIHGQLSSDRQGLGSDQHYTGLGSGHNRAVVGMSCGYRLQSLLLDPIPL